MNGLLCGFVLVVGGGSLGCEKVTSFRGEAHVPGGPSGCVAQCNAWRMELVGMVSIGEYSDGCICRVPQQRGPGATGSSSEDGAVSGAAAAGAGVFVAMQEAERQRQAQIHRQQQR
jgi:hypothetical protein